MYIQSYQIHNVLNVYRKQLSQGPVARDQKATQTPPKGDRVEISNNNAQRQSIIDQVAADIVDRITQSGPQTRFNEVLSDQLSRSPGSMTAPRALRRDASFTYTAIDENDQKVTNTLPVEKFSPLMGGVTQNAQKLAD